jgi:hypothetical protein
MGRQGLGALKYQRGAHGGAGLRESFFGGAKVGTVWVRWTTKKFKKVEL